MSLGIFFSIATEWHWFLFCVRFFYELGLKGIPRHLGELPQHPEGIPRACYVIVIDHAQDLFCVHAGADFESILGADAHLSKSLRHSFTNSL